MYGIPDSAGRFQAPSYIFRKYLFWSDPTSNSIPLFAKSFRISYIHCYILPELGRILFFESQYFISGYSHLQASRKMWEFFLKKEIFKGFFCSLLFLIIISLGCPDLITKKETCFMLRNLQSHEELCLMKDYIFHLMLRQKPRMKILPQKVAPWSSLIEQNYEILAFQRNFIWNHQQKRTLFL